MYLYQNLKMKFLKALSGHIAPIYKLVADSGVLYSGSGDGMVAAWDVETLEPLPFSVKVGLPVYAILVRDNLMLIGQGHGGIHVVNRDTKREERHLKFHEKGVFDIAFNPVTRHYYSTGGGGSLAIFDENFELIMPIAFSSSKLRRLSLSEDASELLITSSDGYVHQIDTGYFNQLGSFHAHEGGTYALLQLRDGRLITGGRDAHLRFWKHELGTWHTEGSIEAHNYAIYDLAMTDEAKFASASRDRQVKIWSFDRLKSPERLSADGKTTHKNSVNTLCAVGKRLFTGGDDKLIQAWEVI